MKSENAIERRARVRSIRWFADEEVLTAYENPTKSKEIG
jgi:hypothetical protein